MSAESEAAIIERFNRPWAFYVLATAGPWATWLLAAWISHQPEPGQGRLVLITLLGLAGLLFPFIAAWRLVWPDRILRADLTARLFRFGPRELRLSLLAIAIMLGSILAAQAISLLFGYGAGQFRLAETASFSAGVLSGWVPLLLAPIIEELSWHSYGTDTLRRRMNLFWTSLIFAVYWTFWHAPLGMIEGYYQANVVESGWLYTANFALSLIPFVLLMNWLYYRAGRSILVAIAFHMAGGVFNEMFQTEPMSKVIQTGLLLALTLVIVMREPRTFFSRDLSAV